MSKPKNLSADIRLLLSEGKSNKYIRDLLGISRSTVSHHNKVLGYTDIRFGTRYDWNQIQLSLDAGLTRKELPIKYGYSGSTFDYALSFGKLIDNRCLPQNMSALQYSQFVDGKQYTSAITRILKYKLIAEGKLEKCDNEKCGLTEWMGSKVPLHVDHIDGNSSNHKLINIRFLCPNCHAMTPTWGNKKRF